MDDDRCGTALPTENLDLIKHDPNAPQARPRGDENAEPCANCGHGRGSHRHYQWIGPRDCCAADCRCREFRRVVR